MVKEFQIVLTPPSQGASTSDDIVITGHLLLVTEKTKKGYLFIAVALEGYAKIGLRALIEDSMKLLQQIRPLKPNTFARTTSTSPLLSGKERTHLTTSSLRVPTTLPSF